MPGRVHPDGRDRIEQEMTDHKPPASASSGAQPTSTAPSDNVLYVFWDDLNPELGGEVYYQSLGIAGDRRFVVQWDVANYGGSRGDLMRFQAVLHEAGGAIDVCDVDTINLGNSGDNGAEATSGIQHSSSDGFAYSCNNNDLTNGLQLLYLPH